MVFQDRRILSLNLINLQPDQNMMKPELSGIHRNSSFEVSSYFGQSVVLRIKKSKDIKKAGSWLNQTSWIPTTKYVQKVVECIAEIDGILEDPNFVMLKGLKMP